MVACVVKTVETSMCRVRQMTRPTADNHSWKCATMYAGSDKRFLNYINKPTTFHRSLPTASSTQYSLILSHLIGSVI